MLRDPEVAVHMRTCGSSESQFVKAIQKPIFFVVPSIAGALLSAWCNANTTHSTRIHGYGSVGTGAVTLSFALKIQGVLVYIR